MTSAAKGLTATCPAGTRVIGAGGDTTGANGEVLLDVMRPNAALTSVILHANEDEDGAAAAWYLQAFIICAVAPVGLQLVTATSAASSADKAVTAPCPGGKRLLGSGAEIVGAPSQVLLDGQVPNPGLTAVTVNALEDETGTSATWSIKAYAICADLIAGLQRVAVTGATNTSHTQAGDRALPDGQVGDRDGRHHQQPQRPGGPRRRVPRRTTMTSASIGAQEDGNGNSVAWSLTAYAICAASAQLVTVSRRPGDQWRRLIRVTPRRAGRLAASEATWVGPRAGSDSMPSSRPRTTR